MAKNLVTPYLPALGLAALALLTALWGFGAEQPLAFRREAIAAGEWWRLVSGQWVHLGWSHLGLNLASLALCWTLFGRLLGAGQWLALMVFAQLVVGLGLWWGEPQLQWYVGLSGMLHAPYIVGAAAGWRVRRLESLLLLLILAAKLAWEFMAGPTPGSAEAAGGPVVVAAHLYGALAGVLVVAVAWLRKSISPSRATS